METNEYIVRYIAGGSYGRIIITAHNRKDAAKYAKMQVKYGRKEAGRFQLISVLTEEEDKEEEKLHSGLSFIINTKKIFPD
jgi:hypothetical protein